MRRHRDRPGQVWVRVGAWLRIVLIPACNGFWMETWRRAHLLDITALEETCQRLDVQMPCGPVHVRGQLIRRRKSESCRLCRRSAAVHYMSPSLWRRADVGVATRSDATSVQPVFEGKYCAADTPGIRHSTWSTPVRAVTDELQAILHQGKQAS